MVSIQKKIFFFNLLILIFYYSLNENKKIHPQNLGFQLSKQKDYVNSKFIIIKRRCEICGLFSFFMVHLGCIHKYLLEGYIPIIYIESIPNVIYGFNTSESNFWELFFEQPFGYNFDEIIKNSKTIIYITVGDCMPRPDELYIYYNYPRKQFWHNFANQYLPIKRNIIDQSEKIMYKLFKNSKNILGVLARGTDYISRKPKGHAIPPNLSDIIHDVKEMDDKYNYDYIFFSTEDEIIRDNFTNIFAKKVRQIRPKKIIKYDYIKKDFINYS